MHDPDHQSIGLDILSLDLQRDFLFLLLRRGQVELFVHLGGKIEGV